MRFVAFALTIALLGLLSDSAFAQGGACRAGGGGRSPSMRPTGTERASAFTLNLTSPTETAQRYLMQVQQQEMARAYYMRMQEAASQHAQQVADQREDKRQERIAAVKERREAELARREAAKARRLAASKSESATAYRTASLP